MSTTRTLADRQGGVRRQLKALMVAIGDEDPDALHMILDLRDLVDDGLGQAVRSMRDRGYTDGDIAQALGVTRAAVSKRWPGGGRYVGAAGRYRQTAA